MDTILTVCLTTDNWIAIANIIATVSATVFIGLWIGYVVQKRSSTNRAVKDFFINENMEIRNKYSNFLNELYTNNLSVIRIREWFKIMTIRIEILENTLKDEYKIEANILSGHNEMKYFVTGLEELNNQYGGETINLQPASKNELLRHHKDFTIMLSKLTIKINRTNDK